ncbi:MAG: glycerol-3-phosphate dehydrogenase/oxidase [Anaerolineae bacterium]|nr:glycerol-3-phosphate dehydrogenase/oxidase [Anaerolineae bacterium]
MWHGNWRDELWAQLDGDWDVVVVGGGITGAGILREAARRGLRVLLVEQRDFAWGTSSRSSKLVHGGLRYLAHGQVMLTWASVREREHLLDDGPGLIDPLGFLVATHKGDKPGKWTYRAGLTVYDLMALQWSHRRYSAAAFRMLAPHITDAGLVGGFRYGDAQTDDARLTLRVIREAVADGGARHCAALNYVAATGLLRDDAGQVIGATLHDAVADRVADVRARVVINATGAWADRLRGQVGGEARIRPLRGSHLIFPDWRLPVAQAVAFLHPLDSRPVFVFPWEGVTLVGTTDVDHGAPLDEEPGISPEEVAYLMAAVAHQFPARALTLDDVIASYAGVRPVIGTGKADPSQESRESVVWQEDGLLTVTGGKLTTFRRVALDALKAARDRLPELPKFSAVDPVLDTVEVELPAITDEAVRRRLLGRYGADAPALVEAAQPGELEAIPGTRTLWAELRWAARAEGVVHLEDLLLRRARIGLLLAEGGVDHLERVRQICQHELGWDDDRWAAEAAAYRELWQRHYGLPERALIPDWQAMLAGAQSEEAEPKRRGRTSLVALAGGLALLVVWWRRRAGAKAA